MIADVFQQTFFCASPTDSPYDNTAGVVVVEEDDDTGGAVVGVDHCDHGEYDE